MISYDRSGFGSLRTTLQDAKARDPSITMDDVRRFFPQQQNAVGRFREGTGFREAVPGFDGFRRRCFEVSMGSDRFRRSEGGSKVWVLTGSGFPRFANWFRELVPGFDRFRGSESGNAVWGGIVKHPCCWGYHLRFFFNVEEKRTPRGENSFVAPSPYWEYRLDLFFISKNDLENFQKIRIGLVLINIFTKSPSSSLSSRSRRRMCWLG